MEIGRSKWPIRIGTGRYIEKRRPMGIEVGSSTENQLPEALLKRDLEKLVVILNTRRHPFRSDLRAQMGYVVNDLLRDEPNFIKWRDGLAKRDARFKGRRIVGINLGTLKMGEEFIPLTNSSDRAENIPEEHRLPMDIDLINNFGRFLARSHNRNWIDITLPNSVTPPPKI